MPRVNKAATATGKAQTLTLNNQHWGTLILVFIASQLNNTYASQVNVKYLLLLLLANATTHSNTIICVETGTSLLCAFGISSSPF